MKRKLTLVFTVFMFLICFSNVNAENRFEEIQDNLFTTEFLFEINESGNYDLKEVNGNRNNPERVDVEVDHSEIRFLIRGDDYVNGIYISNLKIWNPSTNDEYYNYSVYCSGTASTVFVATVGGLNIPSNVNYVKVKATGIILYYLINGPLAWGNINDTFAVQS